MQRSLHGWMTCEEFEATLVDYLDGMLGPLARRQVDLHIRLCPHCRRYLRAYDRTRRLAGAALRQDEEPALQAVPEDLVQRSEEHTSELQSLMRISYAVFCLKK